MSKPKNHHYIPECYLANFTNKQGFLYRLKLDDYLSIREASPSAICYSPHFYLIDESLKKKFVNISQYDELAVESRLLKHLEDLFPSLVRGVVKNDISVKEAKLLSQFIVQLKTRTQYWRDSTIPQLINGNIDAILLDMVMDAKKRYPDLPEGIIQDEVAKLANVYKTDPDAKKYLQLSRITIEGDGGRVSLPATAIKESEWSLVVNNTPIPFIATDNPGFSFNIRTMRSSSEGFSQNHAFILPLSSKFVLKIDCTKTDRRSGKKKNIKTISAGFDSVDFVNQNSMVFAHQYIISDDRNCIEAIKRTLFSKIS